MIIFTIVVAIIAFFFVKVLVDIWRSNGENGNKNGSKIDASLRLRQEFSDLEKRLESKQNDMNLARTHAAEELNWILRNESNNKGE